jgi:hypothetical protein
MIVDGLVNASEEGRDAAHALIRHATSAFLKEGLALAGSLMPRNAPFAAALRRAGYWICPEALLPQPFPVIIRWHGAAEPPPGLFDLDRWYLTMGDYDAV